MAKPELRGTFERVAELYDRVRPPYPPELLDGLVDLAAIPPGGRVLEIGPGSGQATVPLAERGLSIVAIELGPRLAALAREKLAPFGGAAEVVVADFETWEPEPGAPAFDAVVSFTALHWISAGVRYAKPARLLSPGGALAVVETQHVRDDDPFWLDVQDDYDSVVPRSENRPSPRPEEVGDLRDELESNGFRDVQVRRYATTVEYTADQYRALLESYSPNIALDPTTRARLLDRIHARVVARRSGRLAKPYLFVLTVGRTPAG